MHIVTGQEASLVAYLLDRWQLVDAIESVTSCADGQLTKEEVFGHVERYLGCIRSDVVVFEDSPEALQQAHSVGLRTVAVIHGLNERLPLHADAYVRLPNSECYGNPLAGD